MLTVRTGHTDVMSDMKSGRYSVSLAELEKTAHVPVDEQVTTQPEPPAPPPMAAEDFDRVRLLGVTGAGRLRPDRAL